MSRIDYSAQNMSRYSRAILSSATACNVTTVTLLTCSLLFEERRLHVGLRNATDPN